jgi:hypothetical protein
MPVIPLKDAIEQLARAVEAAAPEDLAEIHAELFPAKHLPDLSGANAATVAPELARSIRAGIEPEEVVDLWNVVFPADRDVYYDEEDGALRHNESEIRYAGQ